MLSRSLMLASILALASLFPVQTMGRQSISYDPNGFQFNGSYKILRGGSLQWFRLPESEWEDRVEKFKAAGFNTIDMYVPWNLVEPEEGKFNFNKPSIQRFIELAQTYGLYVYFRPGPYITNEMDGGGFPAWLFAKSTKKSVERDGMVNLRTADPDYLDYVRHYFAKLNEVIKPYLITNGGPIILYAIENEFDWFESFFQGSKLFRYKGGWERPFGQETGVSDYFRAMRDMLIEQGINVPITSCPGNAKVAGMGQVEGVIPMPNIYNPPDAMVNSIGDYQGPLMPEKVAYDIVASMHDPLQFEGIYTQMPSASTETFRNASTMKRMLTGGLRGFFAFNIEGFYTPGYFNSITLSNRKGDHIKFDREHIRSFFVKPSIGYFHNVIDFYGAIGPSGMLRNKFFEFRKANLFYDSFEDRLGQLPLPSKVRGFEPSPVVIASHEVGAKEIDSEQRFTYWNQLGDDEFLLALVNETNQDITLPPHSLQIGSLSFPRYSHMTLPLAHYPGADSEASTEKEHTHLMLTNLQIAEDLDLKYTTSEILSNNLIPSEKLLIVFGRKGTAGELALKKTSEWKLHYKEPSVKIELNTDQELALTYPHAPGQFISLKHKSGKIAYIMISDDHDAPRTWPLSELNQKALLISGPDLIQTDKQNRQKSHLKLSQKFFGQHYLTLLAKEPMELSGFRQVSQTKVSHLYKIVLKPVFNVSEEDVPHSIQFTDAKAWSQTLPQTSPILKEWEGDPLPFEKLGIYRGNAWYEAEFFVEDLESFTREPQPLYLQHASDIVGIYLNGQYLTTLSPLGSAIKSNQLESEDFPDFTQFLRQGKNQLLFKVEVWGHGSFMWPRGRLSLTKLSIPSLGFDAFKGIWGASRLGNTLLTNWKLLRGWHPLDRTQAAAARSSETVNAQTPLDLKPGSAVWWETKVSRQTLPDPNSYDAPYSLEIIGSNCKGTIMMDGQVLGRWISDETWLKKGTWVNPIRNPWVDLSPDHFPLPLSSAFAKKDKVTLSVLIEDTSTLGQATGKVDQIQLVLNQEDKGTDDDENEVLVNTYLINKEIEFRTKLEKLIDFLGKLFP
ncbi:MAG: beta-galactosidase [Oligoflexales bacterium]|nr:beta-galactosidase [Oligoflexales bacterium]